MALAFLVIGIVLVVTATRGTASDFYKLVLGDVQGGFIYWLLAIVGVGLLGQIESLKKFSTYFLVLILIVLLLKNKGAIENFQTAFKIPKG